MTQVASAIEIRLGSIDFGKFAFRKLKKVKFKFAPRITLIAGHNGIGKSTILGLVASGSGLTSKKYQSYFDRTFNTKLDEIIFIDYANEFKQTKEDEKLPQPLLSYAIGTETLTKRCALTDRSDYLKARIVPRNYAPSKAFVSANNGLSVGVADLAPKKRIPCRVIQSMQGERHDEDSTGTLHARVQARSGTTGRGGPEPSLGSQDAWPR